MRTVAIEVFTFYELDEKAREKAREWYRSQLNDDFTIESTMITENMVYTLQQEGFEIEKTNVEWNLSNSQSDFVGLSGKLKEKHFHQLIMDKLDNREKKWYKMLAVDETYIDVSHHFKYHHYYGQQYQVDVECHVDEEQHPVIYKLYTKVEELANQILSDELDRMTKKLEKQGYEEIEFLYSDEHIDDVLDVNGYEFEKDGSHYQ